MQGLGFLPGTDQSEAFDASADGSVVVGQSGYPFIWDAVTGMRSLGTLPGSTGGGEAYAVSADGSHVVGLARRFGFVDSEAFLWTESTGLQGLGDLPGSYAYSESRGVSADGRIVVGRSESDEGLEAFIWDPVNGMQELDEY
jgi:probable HAF family extracellular repeat protein